MRRSLPLACVLTLLLSGRSLAEPTAPWAEPWQSPYAGDDATGKHVIALWKFDAGAETQDASGHGLELKLQGATINPKGRFGACLESFPGYPVEDKRHQALVKNDPRLSPGGSFTLELWIQPKPEIAKYGDSFLLDKKYASQNDYQLILGAGSASGERPLHACLGFGEDSASWYSRPVRFEPGHWYHVAFTYDGEGTGAFYVNGIPQGSKCLAGRKQISPGKSGLSIGDRLGSLYHGFPGFIDEVRISLGVRDFRRTKFERVSDRACFLRMEPGASLRLAVTNQQRTPLAAAKVSVALGDTAAEEAQIENLAAGGSTVVEFPIDTRLRPDVYSARARLTVGGPDPQESEEAFEVRIVPRRLPRFPVLMWGVYHGVSEELPRLQRIGFTHALGMGADYARIWEAGAPAAPESPERMAEIKHLLDECLARDFSVVAGLSPGGWLGHQEEFQRITRSGTHKQEKNRKGKTPDALCGLFPEARQFCYNVGASVGKAYGSFPAFSGALIHTEIRDRAHPCFHAHDAEAFRQASGLEIPPEVVGAHGVEYAKLTDFPASRVIPDNDPIYAYYRWYWKQGDGWNALNTAVHEGLHQAAGRKDLWTFHDPAARVARVYGSGGGVDFLSQWTYSYPDPIRIGLAADELLALAAGASHPQQVMKMTQIIWYRGPTAPIPTPGAEPCPFQAAWERQQPDAPFITIAPMHLREAFWTKIARPIKGIMYHGWQSLVPCEHSTGYRYTNPQTQQELTRLVSEVIRPLGPTLLAVPGASGDVAFLESFAAEMFARRGTFGWCGGWAGDAYHALLYAHLQPEIVLDETIAQRGLDRFRVLVMCDCDVLTQAVCARIQAFQARGGLVIGDERTAPAVKPDIVLASRARTGRNADDKAALLAVAAELRKQLDAKYQRYVDSSTPEVIPYLRRFQTTDYVFVVNDRREYGQYVGQHGTVMESGLPSEAVLSIGRKEGYLYDLVEGRPIPVRQEQGRLKADVCLGPCDGRMLMLTARPIEKLSVEGPATVKRGGQAVCTIQVLDPAGRPLDAVVPVEVTIRDAEGRPAEFSGYQAAVGGKLTIALDIASNDVPGMWRIEARELASGRRAAHDMRVEGPQPWPPASKPLPKELANPVQVKG